MAEAERRVAEQLGIWRDDLIDLSRRNRLLNSGSSRSSVIRILEPSLDEVLERLGDADRPHSAAQSWRFHYPPSADMENADTALLDALHAEDPEIGEGRATDELLTDVSSALVLSKRLRTLERKAASEFTDRGLRVLYLGIGILRWKDGSDEWLESPIVMKPVTLMRISPRDPFRLLGTDDDVVLNPALIVKLESDLGITIPDLEESGDIHDSLSALASAVSTQQGWDVRSEILFGAFSFHKEAMYQDLKKNQATILESLLVRAIAGDPSVTDDLMFDAIPEEKVDQVAPPEPMASILDADSTQRQCIVAARNGKSFVMDGPPGTGKSQTIANAIAELLAADKTVLFVSEKAAALEVVKSRLDRAQLGSFVLELHSSKATRKEVAKTLGAALSERPRTRTEISAADIQRAKIRRESLSSYATAQNEIRQPFSNSLHWAIGRASQLEVAPIAPPPDAIDESLSSETFEHALEAARLLASSWGPVERGGEFLWRDLQSPGQLQGRRSQVGGHLDAASRSLDRFTECAGVAADSLQLPRPMSFPESQEFLRLLRMLDERRPVPIEWLTGGNPSERDQYITDLQGRSQQSMAAKVLLDRCGTKWRNLPSDSKDQLTSLCDSLESLAPPLDLRTLDFALLDQTSSLVGHLAEEGAAFTKMAHDLQAELGLERNSSPASILAVAQLAGLGQRPHRPEAAWINQAGLESARRAVATLRPLIESHRALETQLLVTFNRSVFQFDVESLFDSPSDVVPKISKLTSRGRSNRQQLKACCLDGSITGESTAALSQVRRWHWTGAQLRVAEEREAGILGSTYYKSVATDFDELGSALETASLILDLLQTPVAPPERLVHQLSVESSVARHLAAMGEALTMKAKAWRESVGNSALPQVLKQWPPDQVSEWASKVAPYLQAFTKLLEESAVALGPIHSFQQLQHLYDAQTIVNDVEYHFDRSAAGITSHLGGMYQGNTTDWTYVLECSSWATHFVQELGVVLDQTTAATLLNSPLPTEEFDRSLDEVTKSMGVVVDWFSGEQRRTVESELGTRLDDAAYFLQALQDTLGDLDEWATYVGALDQLRSLGLGDLAEFLAVNSVPRSSVEPAAERAILRSWIDAVLASDSRCLPLRAEDRNQQVLEFQDLDRLMVSQAAGMVIDVCNKRRPSSAIGVFGTIRAEAEKKTRHRPIKKLLEDAGIAAQGLKPCFMMSPLSVSQFLPASLRFDAVIFDEASQVRPGDAIGAIYRGDQIIVAGDNKQLPPSNFFEQTSDDGSDEYDPEILDTFESLLDLCRGKASIPELPLRWHYRSRHEDLITYSNRAFYGGHLVTYPAATEVGEEVGLTFIHVPDGVYRRGVGSDNPVEARRVVERIIYHAEHHPHLTIGVVAFSEAQATCIQYQLEAVRRERRDLDDYFQDSRLDGFFIKNLESVQGDERDIIIFSIGFGFDENNKFTMNFGPVGQEGGYRRLNVAITRARNRVEVVSSVRASDFHDTANVNINHLRRYLDFAERGVVALTPITIGEGQPESPFESAVLDVVRGWGYLVEPQVGHAGYRIDMAIRHPEKRGTWLLGIECDGAAYHSSRTARDRDRLRQEVLEGLGWTLHRIWGPAWYHDQRGCESRLKGAIADALSGENIKARPQSPQLRVDIEEIDTSLADRPDWAIPYIVAKGTPGSRQKFSSLSPVMRPSALAPDVIKIVNIEGPIHRDLIVERLRVPWGAEGTRTTFRTAVDDAIDRLVWGSQVLAVEDGFITSSSKSVDDTVKVRVPTEGFPQTRRNAEEVPPSEIRQAMLNLVGEAQSIEKAELFVRVARIFGWGRTGAVISRILNAQLASLVADGEVSVSPEGYVSLRVSR
jgi:REase_MTES_1575/Protein of unknown function (DUF4011)/AAA domain